MGIVLLISFGYLAIRFRGIVEEAAQQFTDPAIWAGLIALAGIYAGLLILLAVAWSITLDRHLPWTRHVVQATAIYASATLTKFLPGNIFHFAGRQVMGRQDGYSHATLAGASGIEIALHLYAALTVSGVALALLGVTDSDQSSALLRGLAGRLPIPAIPAAILLVSLTTVALVLLLRLRGRPIARGHLLAAGALQLVFFLANGLLAAIAWEVMGSASDLDARFLLTAYLASWLVGFVVPGAPGGLGIREGLFLVLLAPVTEPADAVALALALRVITLLGEALFSVGGIWLRRRVKRQRCRAADANHRPGTGKSPLREDQAS